MKILIVDDDHDVSKTIKVAIASAFQADIDVAYSGHECIGLLHSGQRYDLVILDIMMPELNGFDVCNMMAADDELKHIPVMIMSALAVGSKNFQRSFEQYENLDMVKGFLEKPFKINDLISKIKEIIELSS